MYSAIFQVIQEKLFLQLLLVSRGHARLSYSPLFPVVRVFCTLSFCLVHHCISLQFFHTHFFPQCFKQFFKYESLAISSLFSAHLIVSILLYNHSIFRFSVHYLLQFIFMYFPLIFYWCVGLKFLY